MKPSIGPPPLIPAFLLRAFLIEQPTHEPQKYTGMQWLMTAHSWSSAKEYICGNGWCVACLNPSHCVLSHTLHVLHEPQQNHVRQQYPPQHGSHTQHSQHLPPLSPQSSWPSAKPPPLPESGLDIVFLTSEYSSVKDGTVKHTR